MSPPLEYHGLDTPERVCFYEQDFYVLSNFSSFSVKLDAVTYPTSEHAYHAKKFPTDAIAALAILHAPSAHEAFKLGQRFKARRREDWDLVKVDVMRRILRAKVEQHEYVRRKLLATGDRELVENSWRDDYWGWGENKDGQNQLGKLWMELRAELRGSNASAQTPPDSGTKDHEQKQNPEAAETVQTTSVPAVDLPGLVSDSISLDCAQCGHVVKTTLAVVSARSRQCGRIWNPRCPECGHSFIANGQSAGTAD